MLTAKENMRETIKKGGHPDRFVNQYEGIQLLAHPYLANSGSDLNRGDPDKVNAWGITMSFPEGTPGMFPVHTPDKIVVKDIEEWRDAVKAPPLKYSEAEWEQFQAMWEAVDGTKAYKAPLIVAGLFEQTHHLCSMTEVLVYYMTDPDEMHDLIKYLTEWELELAEGICSHLHPDACFHHDDWGSETNSFLRPEMFAEFFLEPYKEIYGYYHDHGCEIVVHHNDSYGANLVDYMIEMGIDVWQGTMESNDVPALLDKYAGQITFMGNIDNKDVDFEGWQPSDCVAAARKALDGRGFQSYIPCITQGGPGSTYSGTYLELVKAIDEYNAEHFGHDIAGIRDAREELQILFE